LRQEWSEEELIDSWTLVGDDLRKLRNKVGATRLGFALMLKFYEIEGRFPTALGEFPHSAVEYVARLAKVAPEFLAQYSLTSRAADYHRAQIRKLFGTREVTEADEERWAEWLAAEVCPVETRAPHLAAALRERCLTERVEAPTAGQIDRVVGSAGRRFEEKFTAETVRRLGSGACGRLEELCSAEGRLAELKSDPGPLGLGAHHHACGQGVDRRAEAGEARRAGQPRRPQGRDLPPLGNPRPAGHPEGHGTADGIHRRVRHGRHPRGAAARHDPASAAAGSVRLGHQHGHLSDVRDRRARGGRGRAAAYPRQPRDQGEPALRDHAGGQRHPRGARPAVVGPGYCHRQRLQALRLVGVEHDDAVPRPLRRDDLLACRARAGVRLLAAEELLLLRGRRHDRRRASALHRRADPGELHRHPRSQRGGWASPSPNCSGSSCCQG